MRVQSRLKEIRIRLGISAAELANRAGVSRQSIYAIEDGKFVPNTAVALQLARALNAGVEELFSIDAEEASTVKADLLARDDMAEGRLVRVCHVKHRLIAVPVSPSPAFLPAADGIVESSRSKTVSIANWATLTENGKRLVLAGCDPALSLLSGSLSRFGMEVIPVSSSSRRALQWLKSGRVHAAGSHLLDRATGDYNVPVIRRRLSNVPVRIVTFAVWEQGLVVRRGNPKGVQDVSDLAGSGLTLINREKGSGSRDLLDTALRRFGIRPEQVSGYHSVAESHLAAAYAVASGTADCCIATRSAARCFGLDFIPLAVERFDLAFARGSLDLPVTKAVLDLLNRANFRSKLQNIAGYDTAHTGEILI